MSPEDITVQSIVLWVVAGSTVLNFIVALWSLMSGPSRKNASLLNKLIDEASSHERRISALENAMKNLPQKEDLHSIKLMVTSVKGDINTLTEVTRRMDQTLVRHDEHLRETQK